MILFKTKETASYSKHSYINVWVSKNCIILNKNGGELPNEIFEFKNYTKLIDICSKYVNKNEINKLKEYLEINCNEVKRLMNTIDNNGQISLF